MAPWKPVTPDALKKQRKGKISGVMTGLGNSAKIF
jgi:hypothetical protein